MKRIKQSSSKLKLGKEVVGSLTKNEQSTLLGGKAAATTSYNQCSGFLCCNPTGSDTMFSKVFKCLEEGVADPE